MNVLKNYENNIECTFIRRTKGKLGNFVDFHFFSHVFLRILANRHLNEGLCVAENYKETYIKMN